MQATSILCTFNYKNGQKECSGLGVQAKLYANFIKNITNKKVGT